MAIFERKGGRKREEFVPPIAVEEINIPSGVKVSLPGDIGRIDDRTDSLAPVFVKISKYREILNTVNYLKLGFNIIKNQMAILSKLENLQRENMKLMYSALDKISDQLSKLDSDFTKPMDFMKDVSETEMQEVEELGSTITDLKSQIDKLKLEVDSLV